MKYFLFLLLLLGGGFLFWKYTEAPSLPATEESGIVSYTVKKGDTLSSISREYSTTVDSIKKRNQLSSDTISIGQILKVKSGETTSAPHAVTSLTPSTQKTETPQPKSTTPTKPVAKKDLPKNTVMETSRIAIDIDSQNRVYLKNSTGKFVPAGTIVYGSDADANGMEVKTITYRDLKGTETTLPGDADPEAVIRAALKK